jgi:hypothetical protein
MLYESIVLLFFFFYFVYFASQQSRTVASLDPIACLQLPSIPYLISLLQNCMLGVNSAGVSPAPALSISSSQSVYANLPDHLFLNHDKKVIACILRDCSLFLLEIVRQSKAARRQQSSPRHLSCPIPKVLHTFTQRSYAIVVLPIASSTIIMIIIIILMILLLS